MIPFDYAQDHRSQAEYEENFNRGIANQIKTITAFYEMLVIVLPAHEVELAPFEVEQFNLYPPEYSVDHTILIDGLKIPFEVKHSNSHHLPTDYKQNQVNKLIHIPNSYILSSLSDRFWVLRPKFVHSCPQVISKAQGDKPCYQVPPEYFAGRAVYWTIPPLYQQKADVI